jgi:hypothetical protein
VSTADGLKATVDPLGNDATAYLEYGPTTAVRRARFRTGAKLTFTITKPGYRTLVRTLSVRR